MPLLRGRAKCRFTPRVFLLFSLEINVCFRESPQIIDFDLHSNLKIRHSIRQSGTYPSRVVHNSVFTGNLLPRISQWTEGENLWLAVRWRRLSSRCTTASSRALHQFLYTSVVLTGGSFTTLGLMLEKKQNLPAGCLPVSA